MPTYRPVTFSKKMRFIKHFRRLCTSIPVAEVPKSRSKRLVNHVKNILEDYKTVAQETWQDMKDRPIKASIYISLVGGAVTLAKTNPGMKEFNIRLAESNIDLMLVGEPIQNPNSVSFISHMTKEAGESRLRCYNFGLFSLMCEKQHPPYVGLYEANCKYIKPHWTELYKTIVDVGVFGKWRNLEKAMENYDVNPEEWLPDGEPNEKYTGYIERNQNLVSWDMKVK